MFGQTSFTRHLLTVCCSTVALLISSASADAHTKAMRQSWYAIWKPAKSLPGEPTNLSQRQA